MKIKEIYLDSIPLLLYGSEYNKKIYLYVHGKCGRKEEAEQFAMKADKLGYNVISFDLPGHGDRSNIEDFVPWKIIVELELIWKYISNKWKDISLYGNSIGAYCIFLAYKNKKINNCLFVSPIVNMEYLINNMMKYQSVTIDELKEKENINDLSWKYYEYVINNRIISWNIKTNILYGDKDNLMSYDIMKEFCDNNRIDLTVMKNGEHWFHTEEQILFLNSWIDNKINK